MERCTWTLGASAFWYYLHDSGKNLHPSRNKAEHEAYRKRYDVY